MWSERNGGHRRDDTAGNTMDLNKLGLLYGQATSPNFECPGSVFVCRSPVALQSSGETTRMGIADKQ